VITASTWPGCYADQPPGDNAPGPLGRRARESRRSPGRGPQRSGREQAPNHPGPKGHRTRLQVNTAADLDRTVRACELHGRERSETGGLTFRPEGRRCAQSDKKEVRTAQALTRGSR
jgi:hypothetical protein